MPKWDISSRKRKQHKRCWHAWCIRRCCVFQMAQPDRVLGVCLIHCTGTTAGFMESMKDKVSAIPLYQHNSRPCGVHGRWCERQTLWSPWKMGWETQTLWSQWKTRWVPFRCTSTTADFAESLNDEGVYSFISLHGQCHFFACILGSMNDIDKVGSSFALYWHCTFTADLVESMNDKVGSSFSVYWCYSWPCWVHEWQNG